MLQVLQSLYLANLYIFDELKSLIIVEYSNFSGSNSILATRIYLIAFNNYFRIDQNSISIHRYFAETISRWRSGIDSSNIQ